MPYTGPDDESLPKWLKKEEEKYRTAWVKAWNASFKNCQDRKGEEGAPEDCEGYAFGTAENVIKHMKEKAEMSYDDALFAELKDVDPNVGGGVDRDKIPAEDFVDPKGRRFPIVETGDVSDAVSNYGRAKPKIPFDKFKSRLIAICKRKGAKFVAALPQEWKDEMELSLPEGSSYDDISRIIYDAFETLFRGRAAIPMSPDFWIKEVFEDYIIVNASGKYFKVAYAVDGEKVTFADREKWETVVEESKWVPTPNELVVGGLHANIGENILSVELSEEALVEGKAFDGLTTGDFTDMSGAAVKIKDADLQTCLENTLAAIEASKSESGEIVGLPIDARGHEKGDGAGWIVGASLEDGKLRLLPKWTEIGKELIEKGIRRFFSATMDIKNKVILGGTLTNWPAVRDKKGRVLLRPVELEYQINIQEVDVTKIITLTQDELNALIAKQVATLQTVPPPAGDPPVNLDSFFELGGLSEETKEQRKKEIRQYVETVRKQAELEYKQEMVRLQFQDRMTELAHELTGGNDTAPRGLRVAAEELQTHLLKLDPDEAAFWGELLKKTQKDGFIEFGEVGHGRDPKGLKQLPEEFAKKLDEGTLAIVDLSAPESGLGDIDQYDLSKWKK